MLSCKVFSSTEQPGQYRSCQGLTFLYRLATGHGRKPWFFIDVVRGSSNGDFLAAFRETTHLPQ